VLYRQRMSQTAEARLQLIRSSQESYVVPNPDGAAPHTYHSHD
jgi:hypothetical protein